MTKNFASGIEAHAYYYKTGYHTEENFNYGDAYRTMVDRINGRMVAIYHRGMLNWDAVEMELKEEK